MCRLAAFPPGTTKEQAIELLMPFNSYNDDGVGTAYVGPDGQFVVHKTPLEMKKALERGIPLFDHMPYAGWTIAHLRAASNGEPCDKNTHPFIKGDWAFCHNGIWGGYKLAKGLIPDLPVEGDTDSEVAAALWAKLGPAGFIRAIGDGGVYLALHRSGEVIVHVTYGDAEIQRQEDGTFLLVSHLPYDKAGAPVKKIEKGWIQFHADGRVAHAGAKTTTRFSYQGRGSYQSSGGSSGWRGYQGADQSRGAIDYRMAQTGSDKPAGSEVKSGISRRCG